MTAIDFYNANKTNVVNVPRPGHPEDKSGWDGVRRCSEAGIFAKDALVMSLSDACDFADKFAAQAHQQAIADLIPQLEKSRQDSVARSEKWGDAKEHDKAQYWMGVAWGQADAIGLCRRSLTPPPALTAKNEEFARKNLSQPSTIFGTVPDKEGPR